MSSEFLAGGLSTELCQDSNEAPLSGPQFSPKDLSNKEWPLIVFLSHHLAPLLLARLMTSPFSRSTSTPGHGILSVNTLPPSVPNLANLTFTYPLKLISPSPTSTSKCILVFLLTYGGGLVGGDVIDLDISIGAGARLALVTQGSTKVFKAPSRDTVTSQTLSVTIEQDGALLYLPDPVQPFAQSVYEQRQRFRVDPQQSNICMLDWVSEGRTARGERWDLCSWKSHNEVRDSTWDGPLLLRDNVYLEDSDSAGVTASLEKRMHGLAVFGTLFLRGPLFEALKGFFIDEFHAMPRIGAKDWSTGPDSSVLSPREEFRTARQQREKLKGVLWTAAAVRGFVLVKLGAPSIDGARAWLRDMLTEEGTVAREFGEACLLCLR